MGKVHARAAAAVAALVALAAVAGAGAFAASREDAPPASTTTTAAPATTTTTDPAAAVAAALASTLRDDLPVEVTDAEAQCIAQGVVAVVPPGRLDAVAAAPDPLAALDDQLRSSLLRAVVTCLPPATAAALLGEPTSTTVPVVLPDEGG